MSTSLVTAQQYMSLYGLSTFYVFGTIGNILLIRICVQPTHRKNSCSLYLLSATIVNFILIQCILPLAIYSGNHTDPQNVILLWCKIRSYLFNALLMLYRWFKMAACVDRAAMCSRHAWIRSFSTAKYACRTILIITIVWLLIPIHLAVYFRIENGRCVPESGIYAKFFSAYSIIISGWSPPIVMAIFGGLAYLNLKKLSARIAPMNGGLNRINNDSSMNLNGRIMNYDRRIGRRDQQLLLSLVSITSNEVKSAERIRIESFISYFSTPFLIIINNCAPFYLYLLVSSKFRQDVKRLFTSYCGIRQQIQEQNNQSTTGNTFVGTNRSLASVRS